MTCWAVLPVKAPDVCKTRLRSVLDEAGRRTLVDAMLRHVASVAASVKQIDRVLLIGPSRHGLADDMPLLEDAGADLNAAMATALRAASEAGVDRLLLVSPDLPLIRHDDLLALAMDDPHGMAGAPDRAGRGTNALSLPLPAARDFRFGYGPGSFARHAIEAERIGLRFRIVRAAGLALDIDTPADLAALAAATAD